mmetsp:Transcript_14566/g.40020  ORF Transcript_14566/g.40020 Transcript_14566/m.40020 type:complete len:321 (+) Transcript_14566:843-1805(+)
MFHGLQGLETPFHHPNILDGDARHDEIRTVDAVVQTCQHLAAKSGATPPLRPNRNDRQHAACTADNHEHLNVNEEDLCERFEHQGFDLFHELRAQHATDERGKIVQGPRFEQIPKLVVGIHGAALNLSLLRGVPVANAIERGHVIFSDEGPGARNILSAHHPVHHRKQEDLNGALSRQTDHASPMLGYLAAIPAHLRLEVPCALQDDAGQADTVGDNDGSKGGEGKHKQWVRNLASQRIWERHGHGRHVQRQVVVIEQREKLTHEEVDEVQTHEQPPLQQLYHTATQAVKNTPPRGGFRHNIGQTICRHVIPIQPCRRCW